MPNLACVFDMRPTPTKAETFLPRFAGVLNVDGVVYEVRSWSDDRFAGVNLLNGNCGNTRQPATSDDGMVLFLDGEIYNLPEVWRDQQKLEHGDLDPTAMCLELYLGQGDEFVSALSGQFNIVLYDSAKNTVKVFNDRLAYRPFFYWCSQGLAIFGNEIKAILSAAQDKPEFDPTGVLEFMTFGHCLNDHTIYRGVRSMRQGSVLEFQNGGVEKKHYWRPMYATPPSRLSLEDAAVELGRRIIKSVARIARSERNYGIFLSGGLDSRTGAAALARARTDVVSFTWGAEDSRDLELGRQLASRLGFDFNRIRYNDVSLSRVLPMVVWRTEGSVRFDTPLSIARHADIATKAKVVFNGHFGNTLFGSAFLPGHFLVRDAKQLTEFILKRKQVLDSQQRRALFRQSFITDALPALARDVENTIRGIPADRLPLAYNLWNMSVRQQKITFTTSMVDRYVIEPVTPFIDNDVVGFMLDVPLRFLFSRVLYKRMILVTFPEIADVAYAKTGRPLADRWWVDVGIKGWRYMGKRIRSIGPEERARSTNGRLGDLKDYVETRLDWDVFPDEIFDKDGVRRTIASALEGAGPASPVFYLLTLAECARLFMSAEVSEPPAETQPPI